MIRTDNIIPSVLTTKAIVMRENKKGGSCCFLLFLSQAYLK
ncbi:hypothetical protein HMPREF0971_02767 [Segatella oris F0302]|uniref:Uncharacterized protein n=1 Tax=Segatella oris F0302 TaxID=649760 RepID=D1QUT2_9BACT|nr:hypothetical protein HMPREF0971_02767 [Segatella oris F0302]